MSLSDIELLRHMLEEMAFVLHNTSGKTENQVINDPILCRAIVRSMEIVGEAAKKINPDFKAKHSEIEWRKLAGLRDKLIHHYFGIDYDIIWDIIVNKFPNDKDFIEQILSA
jgi:uncharacterized protein with HEPN domain